MGLWEGIVKVPVISRGGVEQACWLWFFAVYCVYLCMRSYLYVYMYVYVYNIKSCFESEFTEL